MRANRPEHFIARAVKVVGLGGSLAEASSSLAALKIALSGASDAGAETRLFDVRAMQLPLYLPRTTQVPEAARELAEAVYQANGLLWSSPMYHGTISRLQRRGLAGAPGGPLPAVSD